MVKKNKEPVLRKWAKISKHGSGCRIRFRLNGVNYSFNPLPGSKFDDAATRKKLEEICNKIDLDILTGNFDFNDIKLSKYLLIKPDSEINHDDPNIFNVWQNYVKFKTDNNQIESTTLNKDFKQVKNLFDKIPVDCQKYSKSEELYNQSLKVYAPGTLRNLFKYISASANWYEQSMGIKNPYVNFSSRVTASIKTSKNRSNKAYSKSDWQRIVRAFENNEFSPQFKHSYYLNFIKFMSLTGQRPSVLAALEWDDFKIENGYRFIVFNKAYRNGVLKGLKTDKISKRRDKPNKAVLFPINVELGKLIDSLPKRHETLVFPSPTGKRFDVNNFTKRVFTPVCTKLFEMGEISQKLPTYNLRHTFQTNLRFSGVSDEIIAALTDTSPEMLRKHYGDNSRTVFLELPEID